MITNTVQFMERKSKNYQRRELWAEPISDKDQDLEKVQPLKEIDV